MDSVHAAVFRMHLPVVAAAGSGAFADRGVAPRWTVVGSSREQRTLVETGEAQLAHTAVDNVAGWHSQERPWAVLRIIDLGIPHQLVATPPRATLADMRGTRIAVDSARSGFVTLLRAVLAERGLADDIEFVEVGALQQRLEALQAGSVDGCLLGAEQLATAVAGGAQAIGSLNDFFPGYPGLVVCGVAGRVEQHSDVAGRYADALQEAAGWCFEPARHGEAVACAQEVLELEPDAADAWYRAELARCAGTVGPGGEGPVLARAWRATGRLAVGQDIPAGWLRPELIGAAARAAATSAACEDNAS